MRKPHLLTALLAPIFLLSPFTAFASEGQNITYKSGSESVHALLYLPAGNARHPAIVLVHEWWGLNDWIKQQAETWSDRGYVVLAADLYRGKVAADPEEAHELMRGLPEDRGVRDLVGAVEYLRARKDVYPDRIGAIGWCMGGGYALQLAIADPHLHAVAINYGALATDPASLARIHAAVLGNFGALDMGIPPSSVDAFAASLKRLGKSVDVKVYPDAGHAFENPNNKRGYRAKDAADAQIRMKAFFQAHLQ